MAKKDSVQKRLETVRPPRVQLTYDVEIGDAIEKKELPFVVGVLGDFSGQPNADKPLPKIKDRKFVHPRKLLIGSSRIYGNEDKRRIAIDR